MKLIFLYGLLATFANFTSANIEKSQTPQSLTFNLKNPFSLTHFKKNIKKTQPRLMLTPEWETLIREKLKNDDLVKLYFEKLKFNAEKILGEPILTRKITGIRMLATSREMLYRMSVLSMIYRIERNSFILKRITAELATVANFPDWNPSHFLDTAEMSLAVSIAVDWVGEDLPKPILKRVKTALLQKGLEPSFKDTENNWWISASNNWNQVCHGSMIAAAIVLAEKAPELAVKTLQRALENLPFALEQYAPDGAYPEGPSYWGYGTAFSAMTSSMLQSAFGTDYGISAYPAFLASALFRLMSVSPSGHFYNFSDSADQRSAEGNILLAWFAAQTGNGLYLERNRFMRSPKRKERLSNIAGLGLIWLSQFQEKETTQLPNAWKSEGDNPVVIFRDSQRQLYFGAKGGKGSVNHGNLDAGSFIFELDGVRWAIDLGNQSYHNLEKNNFDLWNREQNSQRWTLLTKNNFGHSTLSLDNQLHWVDGFAPLIDFHKKPNLQASFDLSSVLNGINSNKRKITRRFLLESKQSLLIEDHINLPDSIPQITWQMMTTAKIKIINEGLLLLQDGKQLKIEILSHPELQFSIISLDPPPLFLDKKIKGLKRIELRIPTYWLNKTGNLLQIRLSGLDNKNLPIKIGKHTCNHNQKQNKILK